MHTALYLSFPPPLHLQIQSCLPNSKNLPTHSTFPSQSVSTSFLIPLVPFHQHIWYTQSRPHLNCQSSHCISYVPNVYRQYSFLSLLQRLSYTLHTSHFPESEGKNKAKPCFKFEAGLPGFCEHYSIDQILTIEYIWLCFLLGQSWGHDNNWQCEYIWEAGVGFTHSPTSNPSYDRNRTEILKLLLACFSETMYLPPVGMVCGLLLPIFKFVIMCLCCCPMALCHVVLCPTYFDVTLTVCLFSDLFLLLTTQSAIRINRKTDRCILTNELYKMLIIPVPI